MTNRLIAAARKGWCQVPCVIYAVTVNYLNKDQWLRDVGARQRNVVFPDTAANEARFWRNIISRKEKLHPYQIAGIALIYLALAAAIYGAASAQMRVLGIQGTLWQRIWGNFGGFVILFGIIGLFLLTGWLINRSFSKKPLQPALKGRRRP